MILDFVSFCFCALAAALLWLSLREIYRRL
jgi:hypothetical protein